MSFIPMQSFHYFNQSVAWKCIESKSDVDYTNDFTTGGKKNAKWWHEPCVCATDSLAQSLATTQKQWSD